LGADFRRELALLLLPVGSLAVANTMGTADIYAKEASNAAKALGDEVHVLNASTEHDLGLADHGNLLVQLDRGISFNVTACARAVAD
jgi:hypothetical protein